MTGSGLPPSSRTVLHLLDSSGSMTHKETVVAVEPRTAHRPIHAEEGLKEHHLIIEKFNFKDARRIIYLSRPAAVAVPA